MTRKFHEKSRNLIAASVSLLVLLVAFLGAAFADRMPEPLEPQVQQRRAPHSPRIVPHPPRIVQPQGPVRHDTKFRAVPGSKLQIRAVEYDGSTNGTLTVQLKNPTKQEIAFDANGLYFVPEGDPDTAPQRLGAVGPMQIVGDREQAERKQIKVAAGATLEVNLDVFCIDSHRSSPSPRNVFNVGATKMPKELTATIERSANRAVDQAKASGHAAPRPAAKGQIQGEVWKSRDAKWIELDGEGEQEVTKKR